QIPVVGSLTPSVLIEHVPDQDVESILNDLAAEPAWRSVRSEFIWRFVIESAFSTLEGESKALTPSSLASCVSIIQLGPDLSLRRERSAFAHARSIWSHPITLNSLTRGGMD